MFYLRNYYFCYSLFLLPFRHRQRYNVALASRGRQALCYRSYRNARCAYGMVIYYEPYQRIPVFSERKKVTYIQTSKKLSTIDSINIVKSHKIRRSNDK